MIDTCPVCQNSSYSYLRPYRGKHQLFLDKKLKFCQGCGLVYASPMPEESKLSNYNSNYFEEAHQGKPDDLLELSFFKAIAKIRQQYILNYIEKFNIKINSILEWGPGPGFFAKTWLAKFPDNEYQAIETDIACHESLAKAGVKIVHNDSIPDLKNDLIVMSHVLEHVSDPSRFIQTSTNTLVKGGALFIEVPCRDWEHKLLDEPHLLFFEKKSLGLLLENHGFANIQLSYHGRKIQSLRSNSLLYRIWNSIRSRLIEYGVNYPFSQNDSGMEYIPEPVERAVVFPYKAHLENQEPSWWLRAIAIKS